MEKFTEYINSKDLRKIRLSLVHYILVNPTQEKFEMMAKEVKDAHLNVYVEHDGERFKPEDEWDKDYLIEQKAQVIRNFSKERVALLQGIAAKLKISEEFKINQKSENLPSCNQQSNQPLEEPVFVTLCKRVLIKTIDAIKHLLLK